MKNYKSELFTLRVQVEDNGRPIVTLSCEKDGKDGDLSLLGGDNLCIAYSSLTYAASILARLYVRQLHDDGKISDEEYNKLINQTKKIK